MPAFTLRAHPAHPPAAVRAVHVDVRREKGCLELTYTVEGGEVLLPAPAPPERTDGLWRTTCFELFVADAHGSGYREFNFSPSGAWAAYAFDDYRRGMRDAEVEVMVAPATSAVHVTLATDLPSGAPMALTAVIEEVGGAKSYWSLAHLGAAPDFHDRACFAARVPAAGAP